VFLGKSRKFLILRDFFYLYTSSHPIHCNPNAGKTTMSHQIFNRALKIVGFVALAAAFAVPAANAAAAKNTIVKKQHASSKASASKKVVSTRKSVRFVAGTKQRRGSIIRASVPAKPFFRPDRRIAQRAGSAGTQVQRGAGDRPGHA
jgi:hypothetical protein